MKVLLDTGVWWRWTTNGPMNPSLREFLKDGIKEAYLCPVSVFELLYKVRIGKEPEPNIADWRTRIVAGFKLAPVSTEAAVVAAEWDWEHGDPMDRILAAVALTENLTLIHTDTRLRNLKGFPHRYFKGAPLPQSPR